MIQMVSHLSFWFSWFSQCHFCRCPVQTPRNRPLHGYLELLSRYPEGCFHHPELPSKTSVMSVVEHPREVLGRRKKPFVFFFVIMVRNLNFIDIVCLVAGVVAFGSLFLRHVVFFQHIVLLPRPCGNSKLRARNVVTPGRETEGSFILGNRRPAFGRTATWFGQQWGFGGKDTKTGTGPGTGSCWLNDFLRFQYFPELVVQYFDIVPGVVLPVTVKEAYAYLSKFTLFA